MEQWTRGDPRNMAQRQGGVGPPEPSHPQQLPEDSEGYSAVNNYVQNSR